MSKPLANESHPPWGRRYPKYTASYTHDALGVTLLHCSDSHSPRATSETIDAICDFAYSKAGASVDHITLSKLQDLCDLTNVPGVLESMAKPDLVYGCVSLMVSVKPSALEYEYGYVCFRILVIALNACLLKHTGYLDEGSSWLVYQKSREDTMIRATKLFDEHVLDQLLKLLHRDKKLFLVVSKATGSLGLSALMFVLLRYLLATEKWYRSSEEHVAEVVRPYTRIFWRYFVVTLDSEPEEIAMFDLHSSVAPRSALYYEKPVDVEDSVNLVQALNDRMESSRPVSSIIVAAMLRFVAPLVVPGCEHLIPTTVKRCIAILWRSMLIKTDAAYARQAVLNFLLYLRDMLMALKSPEFTNQPWIWEVIDHVIEGDLLDLALRVFFTASKFDKNDLAGPEGQLFSAPIETFIALYELAPVPQLAIRFFDSGSLGAWSKCYFYFRVNGTENTFQDSFSSKSSVNWGCGEIIAGVMSVLIGPGWESFVSQAAGSLRR